MIEQNRMEKPVGSPHVATDTDKPNRKYPRADFHDYNAGCYFVTACTKAKKHYFGKIYDNEMHLSALGLRLDESIQSVAQHYPDIEIPLYVIMPNHFHAIIVISGTNAKVNEHHNYGKLNPLARSTVATCGDPTLTTHHANRLGLVVGAIKSAVTRFAKLNNIEFGWQSRYHDHIIRGKEDGDNIAKYIENNVVKWNEDCFNR